MKKKFTLAVNVGTIDAQRFGLTETAKGKSVDVEAKYADELLKRGWVTTGDKPADEPAAAAVEESEESPVSDTNAGDAIEAIGRMRSREKLQDVIDTDTRTTVVEAARRRLADL